MSPKSVLLATLFSSILAAAQPTRCPAGAVCFSGKVSQAKSFRRFLNSQLEFVLRLPDGIAILPRQPDKDCRELAAVVNPPYHQHRALDFNSSHGWTAEQEATTSPREFLFVTNCADYFTENERLSIVLYPGSNASEPEYARALADLGSLAHGKGRLWITGFKLSHAQDTPDSKLGRIEWLKFRASRFPFPVRRSSLGLRLPRTQWRTIQNGAAVRRLGCIGAADPGLGSVPETARLARRIVRARATVRTTSHRSTA